MTTSVTIEAHPAAPSTVVEVSIYGNDDTQTNANYVLMDGATHTFTLHGNQTMNVREENTQIVASVIGAG